MKTKRSVVSAVTGGNLNQLNAAKTKRSVVSAVTNGSLNQLNVAKARQGFTLIELMIVIAIIAILAAIAVPSYSNYLIRARVSEAIVAASGLKPAVTEAVQGGNSTTPGSGNTLTATKYATGIAVANSGGIITVTVQSTNSAADTTVVSLVPAISGTTVTGWTCTGTTAAAQYRPGSCQ